MKFGAFTIAMLLSFAVMAQNTFKAVITNDKTDLPLLGATATIPELKIGATADSTGKVIIHNIPNGKFSIRFSFVNLKATERELTFPLKNPDAILKIELEPQEDELAEVTIQTTRTNQNLSDIPTRIEALPTEELD